MRTPTRGCGCQRARPSLPPLPSTHFQSLTECGWIGMADQWASETCLVLLLPSRDRRPSPLGHILCEWWGRELWSLCVTSPIQMELVEFLLQGNNYKFVPGVCLEYLQLYFTEEAFAG